MDQPTGRQFLFAFAIDSLVAWVVFRHAERNGVRHPAGWAIGVWAFLAIALPAYMIYVYRLRRRRAR